MSQHDLYTARAAEARVDALSATLANVRDRCLRAADAWDAMAVRARKGDSYRAREADKVAAHRIAPLIPAAA